MNPEDRYQTIFIEDASDSLDELSKYLDVLSSEARLRILKVLESGPRDVRTISNEIDTSYENTKKHLDRLLTIGVIKKEAGLGAPTSRGIQPVWNYSIVRGGLESIIKNLCVFSNTHVQIVDDEISRRLESVKKMFAKDVLGGVPAAIVIGGADDGKIFLLKNETVLIGRRDPRNLPVGGTENEVCLSSSYTAVTRITTPHGRFVHELDTWYIEDCGSTGGTRLNNKRLEKDARTPVHDGDIIELAKGSSGVKLLMLIQKSPEYSPGILR
jgi:pSer/pThr/pTyr-binding forkhead associated (FHA) protein